MSRKNREPAEREAAELDRTRTLAERHKVSIRTIERWCEAGILPPPLRIRGRKFWPRGTLAKLDPPPAQRQTAQADPRRPARQGLAE
jgi:hypothetical protein